MAEISDIGRQVSCQWPGAHEVSPTVGHTTEVLILVNNYGIVGVLFGWLFFLFVLFLAVSIAFLVGLALVIAISILRLLLR